MSTRIPTSHAFCRNNLSNAFRYHLIYVIVVVLTCCSAGSNALEIPDLLTEVESSPITDGSNNGKPGDQKRSSMFEVPTQILTLAGNQKPIYRSVLHSVTPKQENYLSVIQKSIQSMVHLEDVTLLGFLSWMTEIGRAHV